MGTFLDDVDDFTGHTIKFKPSNVHQGHYVYVDGLETDLVVNLFAYQMIPEYREKTDLKINDFIDKLKTKNNDKISKICR